LKEESFQAKESVKRLSKLKAIIYSQKLAAKAHYTKTRTDVTELIKKFEVLAANADSAYHNMTDIKAELAPMQTLDKKLGAEKLIYQKNIKKYLKDAHKELVPGIYSKEIGNIDSLRKTIGRRIARINKSLRPTIGIRIAGINKMMSRIGLLTNAVTPGSVAKPVNTATHANKNMPANGNRAVKIKASFDAPEPVAATPENVKSAGKIILVVSKIFLLVFL
jgi:hypothetical protein